ncbi:MAG: serine/threonine protein kinase, partial [Anaerolineaceae bacterium]|nr:serine/threonine protein kinase [Anaerolineaceae bacterium]
MTDLSGKYIGRYHILEQLGEGGMAVVYKAFDTKLEREVAIKFIRTGEIAANYHDQMLKRFEREAKALAKFDHPNIITIFDYGKYENTPYLVMQLQPGGTLQEYTASGKPIDLSEAAGLTQKLTAALQYAHKHKVIHRDIKPTNVLISQEGEPRLTDFGIAKILDVDKGTILTRSGVGIGTPEYMAPEQFLGKPVDARADIYGLGVVLYELVTGRRPYQADTPAAVMIKQTTEALPSPLEFNPNMDELLELIIIKALAKEPEFRYQSMADFGRALQEYLESLIKSELVGKEIDDRSETLIEISEVEDPILFTHKDELKWLSNKEKKEVLEVVDLPEIEPASMKKASIPLWGWMLGIFAALIICIFTSLLMIDQMNLWGLFMPVATNSSLEVSSTDTVSSLPSWTETPELIRTSIPDPTQTMIEILGIGSSKTSDVDGMLQMYLPEGEFMMGSDEIQLDDVLELCKQSREDCSLDWFTKELPLHYVYVSAFWID